MRHDIEVDRIIDRHGRERPALMAILQDVQDRYNWICEDHLRQVAEGIAEVLDNGADARAPLYLTMDLDVAKSLGAIMKEELQVAREIIAVDGIDVGDLDYIDIGASLGSTEVIPVTVKSLLFPHSGER